MRQEFGTMHRMLPRHVKGAPRLIDWTGERCVPWAPDVQVVYEHLHRYLWARRLVTGRRVLDLASGEGFGAAILSEEAEEVVGVELDERSVEHAQLNYEAPNLSYQQGDARDLSRFEDDSFGAVVSFEMIEHVDPQEQVIAEIRRVLAPDGLLIISTPNSTGYQAASGQSNPFHVHELTDKEFAALLAEHFAHHAVWAQHAIGGSAMAILPDLGEEPPPKSRSANGGSNFVIGRDADEWDLRDALPRVYMVAVASDAPLPTIPYDSALADAGMDLTKASLKELADRLNPEIVSREEEVERRGNAIQQLEAHNRELTAGIEWRDAQLGRREAELAAATRRHTSLRREFVHVIERERAAMDADRRVARDEFMEAHAEIGRLWERVNHAEAQLQQIWGTVSWQLLQRARGKIFHTLGGEDSLGAEMVHASVRTLGRGLHMQRARRPVAVESSESEESTGTPADDAVAAARQFEPVILPVSDAPVASLVMPLYAGAELTHAALQSIVKNTLFEDYEVILVDDGEDPDTKSLLSSVHGARIITNEANLGYLRSVNLGAQAARGRWLVLCNNDIEVRAGWLDELIGCGESADDIAIVAPKFLAPDGRLAEAGGIIWRDGTGANYGRGDDPQRWRYQYRREVDYGSAAALLVKADFWREVGGFDERFRPMYFEDTDLCFEARARGLKVMYEPRAEVVHHEGSTAGTDENEGHKRHQAENRPKFVEKWGAVLEVEHLLDPGNADGQWLAATARRAEHVLLVDHRVPFWDRESGALRELGIIEALLEMGYHVSFLPDNLAPLEPYTQVLQELGVEVIYDIKSLGEVAQVAERTKLVFISRPDVASRWWSLLRKHALDATLVYDTVDLHWVREARQAALEAGSDEEMLITPSVAWTQALELALVRTADVTTVVTDRERQLLEAEVPTAVVEVLPNVNQVQPVVRGPEGRDGLLFVGGFEHTPNIDAVLYLVSDVMPLVWDELPDLVVRIVGPNAPPEIEALGSDRVEILGWVPDMAPLLDSSRALVAPLTYGAGLKGKVTQALAAGLPVVTTRVGAEGLSTQDGQGLLIGNTAEEFMERVVRVVEDDELWNRLSREGRELAEAVCSPAVVRRALERLLENDRAVDAQARPERAGVTSH
jgi:O-antigen biosynthesis protein